MDQEPYLRIFLFIQLQHLVQIIITVIINRRSILKLQAKMDGINGLPVEPGGVLQVLVKVADSGLQAVGREISGKLGNLISAQVLVHVPADKEHNGIFINHIDAARKNLLQMFQDDLQLQIGKTVADRRDCHDIKGFLKAVAKNL